MAGDSNKVTLTFAGDTDLLTKATKQAKDSVAELSSGTADASKSAKRFDTSLSKLSLVTGGMSTAIGDAGSAVSALSDFQDRGRQKAARQARALADVEQAGLDAAQAIGDLKQAQLDLTQAFVDASQAQADTEQAFLDQKQAALDVTVAQADLRTAIKEHGRASVEAQQATLDLAQAQQDAKQAGIDVSQAQADATQASLDVGQATRDAAQAQRDAKDATLDLADAQHELDPSTTAKWGREIETFTPLVLGAVGVTNLLVTANSALRLSMIKNAAVGVATRTATLAVSAASGVATAAQWAWNVAMTANPIGIIIVAVAALVAAVVLIATKTTWFQDLWRVAWTGIKAAAVAVWDWLKELPGRIGSVFGKVAGFITAPFRAAFNFVVDAWNNTLGRLRWTVPSWIPGLGGKSISAPQLPHFHAGVGAVPGVPGREIMAILQAGERVLPADGGGGRTVLEIRSGGSRLDDLLVQILARAIDLRGGDVQFAFDSGGGRG